MGHDAEGVGDGYATAERVVGVPRPVGGGVGLPGDAARVIVAAGMHRAAGVLHRDLPPEGVVGVGGGEIVGRAAGLDQAVDGDGQGRDGRVGGVGDLVDGLVVTVGDGAADGLVAAGVDADRFGGEEAGRAVGRIGAAEAGEAGAGDGVGEGRVGTGLGVGPGSGLFVPVAGDLYVAGGLAGDAVGAGEVDLAVEVEVLAGEEGIAEFVVGENC